MLNFFFSLSLFTYIRNFCIFATMKQTMITILGPTASGKTSLAAALAAAFPSRMDGMEAEIISADSRQVYRGMDIGTGKDLADYTVGDKQIPYHLIDICEPGTKYNLFQYQQDFYDAYQDVLRRGRLPILVAERDFILSPCSRAIISRLCLRTLCFVSVLPTRAWLSLQRCCNSSRQGTARICTTAPMSTQPSVPFVP